jgi:deazaflavin-dependent oxidoreductase (nitroreductase family)
MLNLKDHSRHAHRGGDMTMQSHPHGSGHAGVVGPTEPALVVRLLVRPMTKLLNPLIVRLAGRRHFRMAAQIRHVGRRSGRLYVTPAGAHLHGGVIVIPLTFGSRSDWARNVRAAGGCSIRLNGRDYRAAEPEILDRDEAGELIKSTFGPLERVGLRMLGIRQFMRLHAEPAGHEPSQGN